MELEKNFLIDKDIVAYFDELILKIRSEKDSILVFTTAESYLLYCIYRDNYQSTNECDERIIYTSHYVKQSIDMDFAKDKNVYLFADKVIEPNNLFYFFMYFKYKTKCKSINPVVYNLNALVFEFKDCTEIFLPEYKKVIGEMHPSE